MGEDALDLNSLDEVSVLTALDDSDARVRECVIAVGQPLAGPSQAVSRALLRPADDADPGRVRTTLQVSRRW